MAQVHLCTHDYMCYSGASAECRHLLGQPDTVEAVVACPRRCERAPPAPKPLRVRALASSRVATAKANVRTFAWIGGALERAT